ncbi:unnamed protein product [Medioppia subpectinata]|uniref:DUF3752 domain-containing protein n=1 Tax=Medioppia subpectinata TaxID=1979941 RepID=A0A7R9Q027_9ACAR|nr:unnamed protein product [Medioppia subpectinata]CAG2107097.1 unnamed protein product [Medioppia subpectinata]
MSDKIIGPTLPPNWTQTTEEDDEDDSDFFGPTLPPDYGSHPHKDTVIGPTLPPSLTANNKTIGPTLPPSLTANNKTIGPTLPPKCTTSDTIIGPTLPPHLSRSHDIVDESDSDSDASDDMIGPILPTHQKYGKINEKFGNSSQILAQMEAKNEVKKQREEWMTSVGEPSAPKMPTKSVTHFSQRPVKSGHQKDDRYYKKDEKKEKELNEIMDSFNKAQKRDVSLIDIHHQKSKKAKNSESNAEERVEFDREKDLSVRKMDSRQTKSVLNKAKGFNDRFSLGVNKFL